MQTVAPCKEIIDVIKIESREITEIVREAI
jgi:hypothetical protein